jgi:hypothetical protein
MSRSQYEVIGKIMPAPGISNLLAAKTYRDHPSQANQPPALTLAMGEATI